MLGVHGRAVIHVAGDPDNVRLEAVNSARDAAGEADVFYVAEVHVADQSCFASAPRSRQIGQLDADAAHAGPSGVDYAVEADRGCGSEKDFVEQAAVDVDSA